MTQIFQKTVNNEISCNGVGLHSGSTASIKLVPAPCNTGVVFRRTDIANEKGSIEANYQNVSKTNLGTTISNEFGSEVLTVEHLMAAIWGCGIDNLFIDINGPEVPIMDGSSEPFLFLIECAGIKIQEESRRVLEILKTIRVEDGDKFAEVSPAKEFVLDLSIHFDHPEIQQQSFKYDPSNTSFKNNICRARTFGFKHEIDHMHKLGLAQGASMENAILLDENGVVNKEGLRYENELVRHKTLDFIGDIYLAGHFILGNFKAFKSGHALNNKLLRSIFADKTAWKIT